MSPREVNVHVLVVRHQVEAASAHLIRVLVTDEYSSGHAISTGLRLELLLHSGHFLRSAPLVIT